MNTCQKSYHIIIPVHSAGGITFSPNLSIFGKRKKKKLKKCRHHQKITISASFNCLLLELFFNSEIVRPSIDTSRGNRKREAYMMAKDLLSVNTSWKLWHALYKLQSETTSRKLWQAKIFICRMHVINFYVSETLTC